MPIVRNWLHFKQIRMRKVIWLWLSSSDQPAARDFIIFLKQVLALQRQPRICKDKSKVKETTKGKPKKAVGNPHHCYLRSAVCGDLVVPVTRTVHYRPCSFAVTGPFHMELSAGIAMQRLYAILIPSWAENWIVRQSLPLAHSWLFNSCKSGQTLTLMAHHHHHHHHQVSARNGTDVSVGVVTAVVGWSSSFAFC